MADEDRHRELSELRDRFAEHFRASVDWRKAKFTWLGTNKPLEAFTFVFRENEHGLFQVHAYRFDTDTSTFIVECDDRSWRNAGLNGR